ncbi:MAG: response regulator [Myxococcales bacterium]|nr:response regulator [Myxococcales bacterium]
MAGESLRATFFESTMGQGGDVEAADEIVGEHGLHRGAGISRYMLLERVGAGGMGVVWAAYDPELDRKVAIKLLRPRRGEGRGEEARTRLLREAQAMARLSHPHVIPVHDVGEHGGRVFVAMEFVEGHTLGAWIREQGPRRNWRTIVDMFVQADTTLDRSQGGLGVGLTLVHNIIELHGGSIRVHSPGVGQGSVFTIRLPTIAQPKLVARGGESPTAMAASATTLALVEDRAEIRETLAEILREDGFQVLTAGNGLEALELIRTNRPHVALVDIGLPGMDGFDLARRLRADPMTASIPLIAMTGYGRSDDRARVREAGFDQHLVKPVDISHIIGALERLGLRAAG